MIEGQNPFDPGLHKLGKSGTRGPKKWDYAAARRSGPACATSRHAAAHRRQTSAHFRIVSPLYFPHSVAQASQNSAHMPQTR